MSATVERCECGNVAVTGGVGRYWCGWCEAHEGHEAPASVQVGRSRLAGTPIATCEACGKRWGYWECGCDLAHDCSS